MIGIEAREPGEISSLNSLLHLRGRSRINISIFVVMYTYIESDMYIEAVTDCGGVARHKSPNSQAPSGALANHYKDDFLFFPNPRHFSSRFFFFRVMDEGSM